jgi:hypothetical protein
MRGDKDGVPISSRHTRHSHFLACRDLGWLESKIGIPKTELTEGIISPSIDLWDALYRPMRRDHGCKGGDPPTPPTPQTAMLCLKPADIEITFLTFGIICGFGLSHA